MRALFPLYLGLRNLLGRKGHPSPYLFGSILGIALSLIPLIVVLEVADGMIEGITRRYLEVGTYHAQVVLPSGTGPEELLSIAESLKREPAVRQVIIERQGMGLMYTPQGRSVATIRAIPPAMYVQDAEFRRYFSLEAGAFDLNQADSILLGREMAQRLKAFVGDRVQILTLLDTSRRRPLPIVTSFTVKGIFSTGYQELDKLWTYIPLSSAERLFPAGGSSQFIGVKVDDPFQRLDAKIFRLRRLLPEQAEVYSWYQLEKANYKSFQTTKALLTFIMALIVAVATVNISSALVMVVLEKTQEIGILKAMGAGPGEISLAFLVTGLATAMAGALLGLAGGVLIAVNVNSLIRGLELLLNGLAELLRLALQPILALPKPWDIRIFNAEFYLESIPIEVRFGELFGVVATTVLLATLAAYLPARTAGRIRPMEVLRRY